jgi:hypothetical protein
MKIANRVLEKLTSKEIKAVQDALKNAVEFDGEDLLSMKFNIEDWEDMEDEDSSGKTIRWKEPTKASGEFKVSDLIELIKDIASDEEVELDIKELNSMIPKLAGALKGVGFKAIDLVKGEWEGELEIKKINQRGKNIVMELDVNSAEAR